MTTIILAFPRLRAARLRCVWVATGNPNQPLVCKWTAGEKSSPNRVEARAEVSGAPPHCKLCA